MSSVSHAATPSINFLKCASSGGVGKADSLIFPVQQVVPEDEVFASQIPEVVRVSCNDTD